MKPVDNAELRKIAEGVVWFHEPETTLRDPRLFLSHVMRYGTLEDVLVTNQYFSDADYHEILKNPPAGLFDERSWNFWHIRLGLNPIPNLLVMRTITESKP